MTESVASPAESRPPSVPARRRALPGTLRGRLLVGVILLMAAGFVGADIASYDLLRSFLDARAHRNVVRIADGLDQTLSRQLGIRQTQGLLATASPAELYVGFLDADSRVVTVLSQQTDSPQQRALVALLDTREPVDIRRVPDRPVVAELAGQPFRVLYHPTSGVLVDASAGVDYQVSATVIALPIRNDQETLNRLAVSEAIVTVVTLIVVAGLGVGVLRLGLRPLGAMAATATAIAEGDLTRRVPVDDPRGEVGQLSLALNRAFDERQRADDRLRGFVADASHELRTPLTTIRGWADLYFQGGLNDAAGLETAMTRIAEEAGQVSRLVEELLLLARLDHQRPLDVAAVDLAAIAGEVVGDARVIDPARPITLRLPAPTEPMLAAGDADRIRQVVRNLVGNALQHTPPGTAVSVEVGPDPGAQRIRLSVADRGQGIPEKDLPYVFERFYRSARDHGSGAGLGLAIVRAIVEAQGGTVQVRSSPGQGATFEVSLPRFVPGPEETAPEQGPREQAKRPAS